MMMFRRVKDSIINNVLGPASAGRFRVVEYQRQAKAAEEVVGNNRLVQVFYSAGDLPKSAGRRRGPVSHDITFKVELTVAAAACSDLAILDDSGSTDQERAAALRNVLESGARTDAAFDELVDLVFQALMDARNIDVGLDKGTVSNTWVDRIEKNDPLDKGEYVTLTGSMMFTCRVSEDVTGINLDEGDAGGKIFDTTVDADGDDIEKTGVEVTAL
jgi:hypothetical protein